MAYKYSDAVNTAAKKKKEAEEAVSNYGTYTSPYTKTINNIYKQIMNRKDFNYDVNGDALYQQYKANAIKNGQLAMQNTMGQAAALTGGWGNSYAVTAGQQAYNDAMTALADRVPELYNLAMQKYNAEGDRLNNMYALASDRDATNYGRWVDQYGRLIDERGYYGDLYNNERSFDYGRFADDRDYTLKEQAAALDKAQFDWQKKMDELNYELSKKKVSSSGSSGGRSRSGGNSGGGRSRSGGNSGGGNGNNGDGNSEIIISDEDIKNAKAFKDTLPTRDAFNHSRSRGEYEGYNDYMDQLLEDYHNKGKITDGEYAWLVRYYEDK